MASAMIEVRGLAKRFGDVQAVGGVDFCATFAGGGYSDGTRHANPPAAPEGTRR